MALNQRERVACRGFTLVELLIVVSIIALVIAIALPSMRKAREQAKRVACASNLSQLGKSLISYGLELDSFPILISHAGASFNCTTWSFGGWTGRNPYWVTWSQGFSHADTDQRPLSAYMFHRSTLRGCGAGGGQPHQPPGESTELPIYKCPSDSVELRHLYEPTGAGQPLHEYNSYDDVGTSYRLNYHWWMQARKQVQQECPECPINLEYYREAARKGQAYWKRYMSAGAARFVILSEQPANIGFFRRVKTIGFHRQFAMHNHAFLDGHVDYIETDTTRYTGRDWTVENEHRPSSIQTSSP